MLSKSFSQSSWLRPLILIALLVLAGAVGAQETQSPTKPEYKIPPADAQKANPVKPTAESVARGKKVYAIDCALCHGENGDGKGDMASDIKNIPDLTNPDVQKNATDGAWYYIIRHGKGDMPAEDAGRAKDEEVWNIVNYLRTLGKK
ncbi:MAG: c-type cytochrome [Terriglobales bacterium]